MPSAFINSGIDVGTLRGPGTLRVQIAFAGTLIWAYSDKRKASFAKAANLPFADDTEAEKREKQAARSNNE
jgi:cytochrome c oxidase cbb3-type subunit 4